MSKKTYSNTKNSVNNFISSSKNIINGQEDNDVVDNLHKKSENDANEDKMDFYENDKKENDEDKDLFEVSDKKN